MTCISLYFHTFINSTEVCASAELNHLMACCQEVPYSLNRHQLHRLFVTKRLTSRPFKDIKTKTLKELLTEDKIHVKKKKKPYAESMCCYGLLYPVKDTSSSDLFQQSQSNSDSTVLNQESNLAFATVSTAD